MHKTMCLLPKQANTNNVTGSEYTLKVWFHGQDTAGTTPLPPSLAGANGRTRLPANSDITGDFVRPHLDRNPTALWNHTLQSGAGVCTICFCVNCYPERRRTLLIKLHCKMKALKGDLSLILRGEMSLFRKV